MNNNAELREDGNGRWPKIFSNLVDIAAATAAKGEFCLAVGFSGDEVEESQGHFN